MVNSGNPSNNHITLRSRYSRHEASRKPQLSSEHPAANNNFRRPPFWPTSTPTGVSLFDLPFGGSLVGKAFSTLRHALISSPMLKFTRLLQKGRLSPMSLSIHSTRPAVVEKALIFHFFSSVTVSKLLCRLNLHCFYIF